MLNPLRSLPSSTVGNLLADAPAIIIMTRLKTFRPFFAPIFYDFYILAHFFHFSDQVHPDWHRGQEWQPPVLRQGTLRGGSRREWGYPAHRAHGRRTQPKWKWVRTFPLVKPTEASLKLIARDFFRSNFARNVNEPHMNTLEKKGVSHVELIA